MKILVAVKRVVDAKIKVRPLPDHSGVDVKLAKMAMNPFDEIAVEKAVTLREAGVADEVVAVTVGPLKAVDTLRVAMAIGADRAVHVRTDDSLEPLAVAKVLRAVVEREQPDLVLLGKQAIDDDANQTGQMLSALCDMPLATFAGEIALEDGSWLVTRETDGGTQTVSLAMPAVVTADLRLAEPRYVTLPAMGKARKKPVEDIELASLGLDTAPRIRILSVEEPPARKAGVMVASVDELVERLKNEAHVILKEGVQQNDSSFDCRTRQRDAQAGDGSGARGCASDDGRRRHPCGGQQRPVRRRTGGRALRRAHGLLRRSSSARTGVSGSARPPRA